MRMTWYIILSLLCLKVSADSLSSLSDFDGEVLEYSLRFRGLNSARSVLSASILDSAFVANWKVDTKPVYSLLFRVHNRYRSRFSLKEGRLLFFEKEIDQKNIRQQFRIDYLWPQNRAVGNFGSSWDVPGETVDVLTMLYRLRLVEDFHRGDSLFTVDVESRICRVVVDSLVARPADKGLRFPVSDFVRLKFLAAEDSQKRAWKTDLLTNRISRRGALLDIWFGAEPQRIPVRLCFRSRDSALFMELESVSNGGGQK